MSFDNMGWGCRAAFTRLAIRMRTTAPKNDDPVAALRDAAKAFAHQRHTHSAIGSDDGGETCGVCGENFRSLVHYRVGESDKTDRERLRAALARIGAAP